MNTSKLRGTWNIQKGKLKKKYAILTENDHLYDEGMIIEKFGKLQLNLSNTKERLRKTISIKQSIQFLN